jgi:hypothetical protein
LEWAEFMIQNEEKRGVSAEHLRPLRECVALVNKHVHSPESKNNE